MYRAVIILFFSIFAFADKIEINADLFEGSKTQQSGSFSGNVSVKKGKDYLKCSKLIIKTNNKNKITSYIAQNVSDFSISMNASTFKGRAGKISYDVLKNTYELKENVKILENNKLLEADFIKIDQNTGVYKVKSNKSNKPVKITFELDK